MARKEYISGYYVRVDLDNAWVRVDLDNAWVPNRPGQSVESRHDEAMRLTRHHAEDIAKEIKKHVEGVSRVVIEKDSAVVCEHCGSPWTEDSLTANGGCCDEDFKVYYQEQGLAYLADLVRDIWRRTNN